MGLLELLLRRKEPPRATVKAVTVFAQDREWTQSALRRGDIATLPKGLIEQADKSLNLRGALAEFVQQTRPAVQKVQALSDAYLHEHVRRRHPHEPFARVELKTSFAVYTVVVVGVKGSESGAVAR
jgi:hypothetical protein